MLAAERMCYPQLGVSLNIDPAAAVVVVVVVVVVIIAAATVVV